MIRNDKKLTQRKLNALETKQKLYDTAIALFSRYGYDNVTIDEITDLAGVSKGTFYNYFESKDVLLVEQYKRTDAYYNSEMEKLPENASASERLLCLIRAVSNYCIDTGMDAMRNLYASQISTARKVQILNNRERCIYQYMNEIISLGQETGEFIIRTNVDDVVELLMRSVRGLVYDWCLYGDEIDIIHEGERYFRIILAILSKDVAFDSME